LTLTSVILARFAIAATSAASLLVGVGAASARVAIKPLDIIENFILARVKIDFKKNVMLEMNECDTVNRKECVVDKFKPRKPLALIQKCT
jgi:hypothetical protein